jgi:hypothetical protein
LAQFAQVIRQAAQDAPNLAPRESVVFPKLYRPSPTIQVKYRLATVPDRVDVGRPMIVRIDH